MSEDEKKKDFFIQEQIKKKPFYKRKGFQKNVRSVTLMMVFGVATGSAFAVVQPIVLNHSRKPDKMVVVGEETDTPESTCEPSTEKIIVEKKELNLEEYERLYGEMTEVAKETQKAIVTVTGLTSELDLFNGVSESRRSATGVIIGKVNENVLILTESSVIQDVETVKITFCDGSITDAGIQAYDEITDLAVLKVFSKEIEERTASLVEPAEFGVSTVVEIGDPIIAVGVDYIAFGMVTAQPYLHICDGKYRQINTDIIGKTENGGVLLNLSGQVVGILGPESKSSDSAMTLNGVGISEIGSMVNSLSNQNVLPYFGIVGRDVTDALAKELSMPKGVIVTKVEENSPAMKKGIQATDVISGMNGRTVRNMQDYMRIMRTLKSGDTVSVNLWRKGKEEYRETKVDITLSQR